VITCRLNEDLTLPKAIQDCFVAMTIDDHRLMKEILANEFNPLSVTIEHVEQMPSTPTCYSTLKQR
jgi:hypothetical protein